VLQGRKLKERLVWRSGFETLDQARKEIASDIETYYRRARSGPPLPHPDGGRKTGRMASD
jgi:hypothetical protein